MYNTAVPANSFEIRVCPSCGLRYPLTDENQFGIRCPACLAETRLARKGKLIRERLADLTPSSSPARRREFAVLLDNLRSAGNVGSILRSAEGFGFSHAFLCGITPTTENNAVQKTSLGAEDSVPWSYHKDAVKLVQGLKVEGWQLYALEEDTRAVPLRQIKNVKTDRLLIVGGEVTGVDPELLSLCNKIFFIPMRGEKKSFNAAVAFGIAAYTLTASK